MYVLYYTNTFYGSHPNSGIEWMTNTMSDMAYNFELSDLLQSTQKTGKLGTYTGNANSWTQPYNHNSDDRGGLIMCA